MAWLRDEAPPGDDDVLVAITVAGLRALGRYVPAGLAEEQVLNDVFLAAIAERSGVVA